MWNRFRNRNNPLQHVSLKGAFDEYSRLTDSALRELQAPASPSRLGLEPLVDDSETVPLTRRRMHGAELRPFLWNTWQQVRQTEHVAMTDKSVAAANGVVDMLAHLAVHLSSSEAQQHLSLTDLMARACLDTETSGDIALAYQLANPESPDAGT